MKHRKPDTTGALGSVVPFSGMCRVGFALFRRKEPNSAPRFSQKKLGNEEPKNWLANRSDVPRMGLGLKHQLERVRPLDTLQNKAKGKTLQTPKPSKNQSSLKGTALVVCV